MESTCPKCTFARDAIALDCPACGVVFSRYDPGRVTSTTANGETLFDSFQPIQARRSSSLAPTSSAQLAGRLLRLGARLADMAVVFAIAVLAGILFGVDESGIVGGLFVLVAGGGLLFYNLQLLRLEGQTIGRRLLGIRIIGTGGERVGLGRLVGMRSLFPMVLSMIPVLGGVFGLINVLLIFGEERRCLHDHFADTVVVVA